MMTATTMAATSLGSSIHATNRIKSNMMIAITTRVGSHLMLSVSAVRQRELILSAFSPGPRSPRADRAVIWLTVVIAIFNGRERRTRCCCPRQRLVNGRHRKTGKGQGRRAARLRPNPGSPSRVPAVPPLRRGLLGGTPARRGRAPLCASVRRCTRTPPSVQDDEDDCSDRGDGGPNKEDRGEHVGSQAWVTGKGAGGPMGAAS
jgi:hypothetical protein